MAPSCRPARIRPRPSRRCVIELHLDESRAQPRDPVGALMRARDKPGMLHGSPPSSRPRRRADWHVEPAADPEHARYGYAPPLPRLSATAAVAWGPWEGQLRPQESRQQRQAENRGAIYCRICSSTLAPLLASAPRGRQRQRIARLRQGRPARTVATDEPAPDRNGQSARPASARDFAKGLLCQWDRAFLNMQAEDCREAPSSRPACQRSLELLFHGRPTNTRVWTFRPAPRACVGRLISARCVCPPRAIDASISSRPLRLRTQREARIRRGRSIDQLHVKPAIAAASQTVEPCADSLFPGGLALMVAATRAESRPPPTRGFHRGFLHALRKAGRSSARVAVAQPGCGREIPLVGPVGALIACSRAFSTRVDTRRPVRWPKPLLRCNAPPRKARNPARMIRQRGLPSALCKLRHGSAVRTTLPYGHSNSAHRCPHLAP